MYQNYFYKLYKLLQVRLPNIVITLKSLIMKYKKTNKKRGDLIEFITGLPSSSTTSFACSETVISITRIADSDLEDSNQ